MIRIVEATPRHIGMMSHRMRVLDHREVVALYGDDVRRAVRRCYHMSAIRRAAFLDGEIIALWGVTGTLLSDECYGWLLTTPKIERVPIAFFREARKQLAEFMETRSIITGHVAADYHQAIEFMQMLGFSVSVPTPMGPNGVMFRELVIRKEG